MNRTVKAIIAVIFVLAVTFSAVSICQNLGKSLKLDITDQKLYTLSEGTKAILAKLNKPIKVKLYYAKTAAIKGPDQIKYFNNYYEFVKSLLAEYAAAANGMIDLQIIDPRPFADEEMQALQYGLRRFNLTEEESFFFGLVVQTQFGVEKVIPFFSPDRHNFVEYDISYLIDTAITRQKTRIGIISSLPVMGDELTGYMAQMMRMQGQQPRPPWAFVQQLTQQYEVNSVPADANDINDVDILLVIHPKDFSEETLFAIDQFVLKGGRTIICVDPYCMSDQQERRELQMGAPGAIGSNLNRLLRTWGLEMPPKTFAGDRALAIKTSMNQNQRAEKIIGFLSLTPPDCFNPETVITSELHEVRFLFPGVLRKVPAPNEPEDARIERVPLVTTTNRGNSWSISSPFELLMPQPSELMDKFVDGTEPVAMAYLVTGRFKSSFPDGIEVEVISDANESGEAESASTSEQKTTKRITGLTKAQEDCAVVVFADADFISDALAYRDFFFGKVVFGDNSALMMNTIDDLTGSSDLISIRSRGHFKRPFIRIDEIEERAEAETAEEEAKINAEITGFQNELQSILASAKEGQEGVVGSSILQKRKDLELKIHQAKRRLRQVKMKRRESIERLGNTLRNFNMLSTPAVILVIAIILGIRRSVRKRHYISHASDA